MSFTKVIIAKYQIVRLVYGCCDTDPNQMWCWDITWLYTWVDGMFFSLFMIVVSGLASLSPIDKLQPIL